MFIYTYVYTFFPCSVKLILSFSLGKLFSEVTAYIFHRKIIFIRCHEQESKEQNRLDSWCIGAGTLLHPPSVFTHCRDRCSWIWLCRSRKVVHTG